MMKGVDEGSAVVVWDREDYIKEAENQLGDTKTYEEVPACFYVRRTLIVKGLTLVRKRGDVYTDTFKLYFIIKDAKFVRFFLLPKIHKRL